MQDSLGLALGIFSYFAAAAAFLYASYWAFAIRRALVGRIYRNHALWLGILSIIVFFSVLTSLVPQGTSLLLYVLNSGPSTVAPLFLFAFIDSTIPIARRSDPLLRNILHWEKVRILAWSVLALDELLSVYFSITNSFSYNGISGFLGLFGIVILVIIGFPPLLVGARRSMDPILRRSLKWLGLALLLLLGLFFVGGLEGALNLSAYDMTYSYGALAWNAAQIPVGYALYRSARSLAPVSRLSLEVAPKVEPPAP
jgi:hypothetical protein